MAQIILSCFGLYLLFLGAGAFAFPARISQFLHGFASSAKVHYLELTLRLLVGVSFVVEAQRALWPTAFAVFGWTLVLTTVPLFLIPWPWHRRFARRVVPAFLRLLPIIGAVSLLSGAAVIAAVWAMGFE